MQTIPNPTPLTIPAIPEQTYPAIWISEFRTIATGPDAGTVTFRWRPYDPETQTIAPPEHTKSMSLPLWEFAHQVPSAAQAMGAVFAAFVDAMAWNAARIEAAKIPTEPETE